jgi:hypothetical protein
MIVHCLRNGRIRVLVYGVVEKREMPLNRHVLKNRRSG